MSLPDADELFRRTATLPEQPVAPDAGPVAPAVPRAPSGRVRHDEKMTVYVTAEELLDLEDARLALRRLGVTVDRGRLVRAAVSLALVDLDEHGAQSAIAGRLAQA